MTAYTRLVDERHPVAGWLYRAAGLPLNGTLVMSFATHAEMRRAATAIMGFRQKGRLGRPGTFEETIRDPRGEGIGYFDRIVVAQRGTELHLKHRPDGYSSLRARPIEPVSVLALDPEGAEPPDGCSRVNVEDFDVVTG